MLPLIPLCFIGPQEPLTARKLKPRFVLLQFTTRHKADSRLVTFSGYLWPFLDLYYTCLIVAMDVPWCLEAEQVGDGLRIDALYQMTAP